MNLALQAATGRDQDLSGKRIVVTAGGTREYLDPVRYISNRSSGKQGIALASAAASRGAHVTLIAANVTEPMPHGITVIRVETGRELAQEVFAATRTADVVIMAAAVTDYAPAHASVTKMKKDANEPVRLELVQTADILQGLSHHRDHSGWPKLVVGFAAETGDEHGSVLDYARTKLAKKDCDLLVVNEVGHGLAFGTSDNQVTILAKNGDSDITVARAPKMTIANAVLDAIATHHK